MTIKDESASCGSRAVPSSPFQKTPIHYRMILDIYTRVLQKLKESNCEEANVADFEAQLWQHFVRLPLRYALDVKVERAEDVLRHLKLLKLVEDFATKPVFEVRCLQVSPRNSAESSHPVLQHEISFSAIDNPISHSQFTSILARLKLNIQEDHAFSTADGFCLHLYVVDGWYQKDSLKDALSKEIVELKLSAVPISTTKYSYPPPIELQHLVASTAAKYFCHQNKKKRTKKISVPDAPYESLRKHFVACGSQQIYNHLYGYAKVNAVFSANLIKVVSSAQRSKAAVMLKLLNRPSQYSLPKTYNIKSASMSFSKVTGTAAVASLFGLAAVAADIVPIFDEKKERVIELQQLRKSFHQHLSMRIEELISWFGKQDDKLKVLEEENGEMRKKMIFLEEENYDMRKRVVVLEEANKRRWFSWLGWRR